MKIAILAVLSLLLMDHKIQAEDLKQNEQAPEETCQAMLSKCKEFSKNLKTTHPDACDTCMTHCKKAQTLCANEKAKENLQSASVHHLHCKHKCLNPSHSE